MDKVNIFEGLLSIRNPLIMLEQSCQKKKNSCASNNYLNSEFFFSNFANDGLKIDFQFQLHSSEVAMLHCH
jgi:hypothetical protein